MELTSDLFIIGGGINGAGIAADAAGRGLSVVLCERNDLASATSSASSKLIHGGLRYLENYQFSLVRNALQEREILLHRAPHLVFPLEFILPYEKHLRPAWMMRIGLFLYDHLASHPLVRSSKKIDFHDDQRGLPLTSEFDFGFSYYDCATDDARLVIANALSAKDNGATILTHTEVVSANYENSQWKIQLKHADKITTCTAKVLVNAAGPWVEQVQKNVIHVSNPFSVKLVKGSHIIIPRLYSGDFAYILQNPDQRVVFAIPYQHDFTLIGTTDVPFTLDTDKIKITSEEETYLCDTINQYFKKSISRKDIIHSYAGVRCLQNENENNPAKLSRDFKFQLNAETPLLTIISGKLTTHRLLSEKAVDKLRQFFPQMKKAWTKDKPLPGGDICEKDFSIYLKKFKDKYSWLPEKLAVRYAKNYGTRAELFLQNATSLSDLGKKIGADLYQKEVAYLIQQEWALTAEDILWRRTKLGLTFSLNEVEELDQLCKIIASQPSSGDGHG